ncbi:fOG: WD40-like repeat protein [Collinsella sp. CAG:289]|nr:fOG: WD40-like repeat protein [Collinsella sp. CAG:289]
MIGQQPHGGERPPAALSSEGARNRMARTIRNMRIASARVLVAFMTMLMVFGTTPAQLWAEGAEGIAQAVASQDAEPTEEGTSSETTGADSVATEDEKPAGDTDSSDSAASAGAQESGSQDVSQPAAKVEAAAGASAKAESAVPSDDGESDIATAAYVTVNSVSLLNAKDQDIVNGLASYTALKVGETIKVGAYYEDDYGDDEEISKSEYDQLEYQWYVGEKQSSAPTASGYTPIEGATSREFIITAAQAGKFVACKVTYGSSKGDYEFTASTKLAIVEDEGATAPATPDAKTLAEAKRKLSTWKPSPVYGTDTNIVDMLSAKLKALGYANVKPTLKSVTFGATDPAQQGGIAADGTITYFFLSNADKTTYSDWSLLRQFKPTYTLALGSETVEFTPEFNSTLAWDQAKVETYLSEQLDAATLTASVKAGIAPSTAKEEELPGALYVGDKKVADLTWTSSDSSAAKLTSSNYNTVYKVAYTHGNGDKNVTFTVRATLFVPGYGNSPSTAITHGYPVKVASKSAEGIAAEKAELEAALAKIDDKIVDYADKTKSVDLTAVEGDFNLPRASKIGADSAKLSYASSDDSVAKINGLRVIVTRDITGSSKTATITATLTRDGITATRDITVTVKPIDESEIDAAVAQMQAVKDAYATSILGTNTSVDAVSTNLSPWSSATVAEDGTISYSKKYETGQIHADDLPGYDSMAGTKWRTYRSSDTSVIADETLHVTQPEADTLVTVESSLTYEKYAALAQAHPDNAKLQSLVNQPVKATYRVVGTTDHSDPQISVNFKLVGVSADGIDEVWFDGAQSVGYGSTADALIEQILDAQGLAHTSSTTEYGYYLSDITSSDGRTLGYDAATGKYWQLFVNGKASEVGASSVTLGAGDSIALYYSAFGASLDDANKATVKASVSFIGPDENGTNTVWASATDVKMSDGSTAADLTEQELKAAGLTYDSKGTSGASFYLASITRAGKTYGWDQSTGKYWQLYINGQYSQKMAGQVTLKPGDKVQWVYAADKEKPLEGLIVNPFVNGPDWDSDWSGYTSADKVTDAPVPTEDAEAKWITALKDPNDYNTYVSDPLLVGDYVYIAAGSKLYKKNVETGETVEAGEAALAAAIDSSSRMVYVNGLILVPLSSGRLQALTVDTLTTKWVTDALPDGTQGKQQSLSSVTVRDGYAYFGSADADWSNSYGGYLLCVRLSDGQVMWNKANQNSVGYYWSGMAFAGGYGVIADDSGTVSVVDPATGDVVSTLKVANRVRSTVLADGSTLYVVSNDGVLHKLSVASDGGLSELDKVSFGFSSTSTPVLANGKIVVGGASADGFTGGYQGKYEYHYGQIAVIDAATMKVENAVCKADGNYIRQYGYDAGGDVKSQPIVSVQDGQTYVYFTSNNNPGGIYRYRVGDEEAELLYTPDTANQNYCMSSVSVGSDGSLYYTNDSGKLFAIKGNGERLKRYTVTFDANGKDVELPASQRVKQGHLAIEPSVQLTYAGYTFAGWYKDVDCTEAWDFSKDVVTADMTLYAKWTKNESPVPSPVPSSRPVSTKGNASSTSLVLTSHATVSLAGVLKSNAARQTGEHESLLAGFDSDELETSVEKSSDRGAVVVTAKKKKVDLPIWPFIGIALGVCVIVLAVLKRKKQGGE